MAEAEPAQDVAQREGSRWLYAPPTEEDVIAWFRSQRLHDGMSHDPYIGGIVTIGAVEKIKVTRRKANGDPMVVEVERSVYVPYVKVDTRIAYFWDYVRALNGGQLDGDYVGVIEPVEVPRVTDRNSGFYNENFPPGFSIHAVRESESKVAKYVCATYRAAIYKRTSLTAEVEHVEQADWRAAPHRQRNERTTVRHRAVPLLEGVGTKQVPTMRRFPDDSALMKAETGAIGRALGVAGILVVGTGVASAEDVQEALSATTPATASPEAAAVPERAAGTPSEAAIASDVGDQSPEEEDRRLRARAMQLREEFERDHPEKWKLYVEWYQGREFPPLAELSGPALKGAVQKLERDLADATSSS